MSQVISDDNAKAVIAENVARILREQGKSQYWLAQATGEYRSRIKAVCDGSSVCSAAMLARMAEALGVTTDELLTSKNSYVQQKNYSHSA